MTDLTEMTKQYVKFQRCMEEALDVYLEEHPHKEENLKYWQSFSVEDWRKEGPTLEVFWATPFYCGHPREHGVVSIPLEDLMPYVKEEWDWCENNNNKEN